MMRNLLCIIFFTALLIVACGKADKPNAQGNFEADEVIVSAQQTGEILSFPINEGDMIQAGQVIGQIDVVIPQLQKAQIEATIASLKEKTNAPEAQEEAIRKRLMVQELQLKQYKHAQQRIENLVKADAATQKQLDDITDRVAQQQQEIAVTRQQINVTATNSAQQNRAIMSEKKPLEIHAQQAQEQINRGQIVNPLTGLVLSKYALKGEIAAIGKPLYKIANVDTLTLRAYITGDKLPFVKVAQQVTVRIDQGAGNYKSYPGILSWVSGKAEFTPKTIQTNDERANLVYAIKVRVKNDGYLKIGMYGEVLFPSDTGK